MSDDVKYYIGMTLVGVIMLIGFGMMAYGAYLESHQIITITITK